MISSRLPWQLTSVLFKQLELFKAMKNILVLQGSNAHLKKIQHSATESLHQCKEFLYHDNIDHKGLLYWCSLDYAW